MNIFCINLNRATDRKHSMTQDWINRLGLDIQFWSAFDRQMIDRHQNMIYECNQNMAKQKFNRVLSNGEIACATSFYQLFEFILTQNINECIIMEDDIIPLIDSKEIIFSSIKKAKIEFPSMELLLMHKISPIQAVNDNPHSGATYEDIFYKKKDCASLCRKSPWGNQCFYITLKAVEIAYQNLCKDTGRVSIWYPADYFAVDLCPLELVCILNNPICDHHWIGDKATTYIGNDCRGTRRKFII